MLNEIANFINDKFHAKKVILFGSYAYGTPTEDSDIDLFVIMNTSMRLPKQAAAIRIELDKYFKIKKPMDIIVRTPEFVNERYKEGDFYIKDILEKGIEL
jgi:predicted nucleotidyltransferase